MDCQRENAAQQDLGGGAGEETHPEVGHIPLDRASIRERLALRVARHSLCAHPLRERVVLLQEARSQAGADRVLAQRWDSDGCQAGRSVLQRLMHLRGQNAARPVSRPRSTVWRNRRLGVLRSLNVREDRSDEAVSSFAGVSGIYGECARASAAARSSARCASCAFAAVAIFARIEEGRL